MKASLILDEELSAEVRRVTPLVGETPATVLRMAVQAGLPIIASQFQRPKPEGYFDSAYQDYPPERAALEEAATKTNQNPER